MAKKGDWIHCNVAHRVGTTMQSHKYNIMAKEFISLFYMWRLCKYKYGYERNPPPPTPPTHTYANIIIGFFHRLIVMFIELCSL